MDDGFDRAGGVPEDVLRLAEAFVFASPEPVTPRALARLLPEGANAYLVLDALQARCAERGVVLEEVGGGWVFRTAPDLAERLRAAFTEPKRLPRAAMEALAAIALGQPITRAEIEAVRGVSLGQSSVEAGLFNAMTQRAF
jgi:segregation and condensation protein B